jgi:hypothetical protein
MKKILSVIYILLIFQATIYADSKLKTVDTTKKIMPFGGLTWSATPYDVLKMLCKFDTVENFYFKDPSDIYWSEVFSKDQVCKDENFNPFEAAYKIKELEQIDMNSQSYIVKAERIKEYLSNEILQIDGKNYALKCRGVADKEYFDLEIKANYIVVNNITFSISYTFKGDSDKGAWKLIQGQKPYSLKFDNKLYYGFTDLSTSTLNAKGSVQTGVVVTNTMVGMYNDEILKNLKQKYKGFNIVEDKYGTALEIKDNYSGVNFESYGGDLTIWYYLTNIKDHKYDGKYKELFKKTIKENKNDLKELL